MNSRKGSLRRTSFLLASLLAGASFLSAADDATTAEIARLKAALAAQQKQLQVLQQAIEQQQQALDHATTVMATQPAAQPANLHPLAPPSSLGDVASLKPVIPVAPTAAVALPLPAPQASGTRPSNPCEASAGDSPAYLRMGNVCIVPIGFMDLTPFWRDKNAASSMGSNFGSVPYNNVTNGNLSEFHFSEQNSRLGLRVDGDWKGAHFIGYNEFDFNGTSGSSSLAVSNGAIVPRLRLFWVDVRKDKIEFLAGQSWSMMTPNRTGISALPGDLFYTQVIDINYVAGLTWTRQPGVRVLYHPSNKVTFGFSVEQPDQYQGGSAGGSAIVLPAALTGLATTQLDNGASVATQSYLAQPGFTPDFIAKVAFDPTSRFHFEVAGVESNFKTTAIAAPFVSHTTHGGGVMVGANAEIFKNFRLITTNFWTDGDGRYLFGQAPDLVVRADGTLSPVHAGGTVDGFEFTHKNTLMYAYYGADYIGRDVAIDTNGSLVGYGYKGSANSQNRAIQELTFGFNQTIWKDPRYGAINVMGQYEWLMRAPWYVAPNAPKGTHDNTIFMDIRYTLPGAMPKF